MNALVPTGRILPNLTQAPVGPPPELRRFGRVDDRTLKTMFAAGATDEEMAAHFGCATTSIYAHRRALRLLRKRGRQVAPDASQRRVQTRSKQTRHAPKVLQGRVAAMPPVDHPALGDKRTIYPSTVVPVSGRLNLLVSGENAWKIGAVVTKGGWAGFPIYTLTLQERATCPTSCTHWRSCFGNQMQWAKRIAHGADLEARLPLEVGVLASRHPAGFAIRLHVLGDFYSTAYVELWRDLVERHPNLHVFGFTARIDRGDPITTALAGLVTDHWPRVALRFSNAPVQVASTVSIEHPLQKPADAIVCPQQTGRTASCSTCALCWSTDRRIAFLRH